MKVTRIRLRSVGSKDVVAVPAAAAALGNDGVAAGNASSSLSASDRAIYPRARELRTNIARQEEEGSTERETDG